jgi:hypothetical protein
MIKLSGNEYYLVRLVDLESKSVYMCNDVGFWLTCEDIGAIQDHISSCAQHRAV